MSFENQIHYASADPYAGTIAPNGKPIVSGQDGADNLHRTGYDWYYDQYGVADDGVINFGFWLTQEELEASYYASQTIPDFYSVSYAFPDYFQAFSAAQQDATRLAIGLWDDLMAVDFQETAAADADITYMNTFMSPAAGAGAFLPGQINGIDEIIEYYYGISEFGRLGGDVFVNRLETANFDPADPGTYALQTLLHETGHALGLEHVGDYNASDDEDGIPGPDPITYANDAFIFQDSHQYSLMSYFGSRETGAATYDFANLEYIYPATPMVHDILAIQDIYGIEWETRAGDTVYGFNSTADRDLFDFEINELPVLTIWDGGGNDTLDFSGWDSDSILNLNEGAFSSGGGSGVPTLEKYREVFDDPDATEADVTAYLTLRNGLDGMLHDNVAIAYHAVIENAVGGGGDDLLIGNAVDNVLKGGAGNDVLMSGAGMDEMFGGAGDDIFAFNSDDLSGGNDKIRDYDAGDKIDLSAFNLSSSAVKIAGSNMFVDTDGVKGYELHVIVQGDSIQMTDIIFG